MVNNRDWTLGENKAKQSQFKATQSQSRLAPSTAVGLKKQSEFATLPAKGAEKALPNAHIESKPENFGEIV